MKARVCLDGAAAVEDSDCERSINCMAKENAPV